MPDELKPCPFCGEASESKIILSSSGMGVEFVACLACGTDGPAEQTKAEAIAAWNRRAADA